jgi:cation diffusion facilitator family transporter
MTDRKLRAALGSLLASLFLTLTKLAVGLATGSLGILSEAAHSALDVGATIVTVIAVRIGDKPADLDHPYGHGKVESVAALVETGLLFLTSAWIVVEAAERLIGGAPPVEATWPAAGVMAMSMIVDFGRARRLGRLAREARSPALEADALHFSSDIWSSAVVLLGLGFVHWGFPVGDPVAAIGVAGFVLLAGWRLGRRTVDTLIDTAPAGIAELAREALADLPDVIRLERVRGGPRGSAIAVDLEVAVARTLPLDRVSEIKAEIAARLRARLPAAEVLVQTRPLALDGETILDRVQVIARAQGVPVHHVTVQRIDGRISVSFDLEVDGEESIADAHRTASTLESAIRRELGAEVEVESHIEPLAIEAVSGTGVEATEHERLRAAIETLAAGTGAILDAHDVRVRRTGRGLYITLHCHVPGEITVEAAHDAANALEQLIRSRIPGTRRIIVHTEPG